MKNGRYKACCTYESPTYVDCEHCDCYRILDISGDYSSAVEACSNEYIWYSDENANVASINTEDEKLSLKKALQSGKIDIFTSLV